MTNTKQIFLDNKVLVVIPTYNNERTIAKVITDVRLYADNILVVNDGSTDDTREVINSTNVESITYEKNRGKGYAIRQSFKYAVRKGFDYVLTIDSDGQHYASDMVSFANSIVSNPDSLIIGARNLQADNMPSKNTFANKFSNFWYHIETWKELDDTQSGFRLYPLRKIGRTKFISNRYEFEVEVIVRSAWKGINVMNIPIHIYYPPQEERVSHFKPLKDFTRISILNSFLVIIALLYYYPWRIISSINKENIKACIRDNIINNSESNHKIASSIGLGIFFGIFPIWGYQMIVAAVVAHFMRFNKALTVISSNISIPPMIPLILFGSYYTGGVLLGRNLSLNISSIAFEDVYRDLFQYIFGAVAFALICGGVAYVVVRVLLLIFRKANG